MEIHFGTESLILLKGVICFMSTLNSQPNQLLLEDLYGCYTWERGDFLK